MDLCTHGAIIGVGQLGRPLVVCDDRSEGVKEEDNMSGWENHSEAHSSDSSSAANDGQSGLELYVVVVVLGGINAGRGVIFSHSSNRSKFAGLGYC